MRADTRLSAVIYLPALTFLVSAWTAAALFYRELPQLMPTHWGMSLKPDGFTAKPWGPFLLPLTMTAVWVARPLIRRLSRPRQRIERFPGAFDFRMMLTVGLVFLIWNVVIARFVSWLHALAVPASVALVIAGTYIATLPLADVEDVVPTGLPTQSGASEAGWARTRRAGGAVLVVLGLGLLALVILSM